MDIDTIKTLITILGFIIVLANQNRTTQKDVEDKAGNWVKVNLKLDMLCQSNTDIKDELRDLNKDNADLFTRMSILEEQIKVANHRIEDLENR